MNQPFLTLNNGEKIPQFGLGVYGIRSDEATENTCTEAIKLGYRHIDTAHVYQNERGVGAAVRKSRVPRNKIWVTSKLWPSEYGEGVTMDGIDKMLKRLETDYIDLLLLHQEFGDFLGAWTDMEKAVKMGKVKSIGISNFESDRLEKLCEAATIKPAALQVECHPYYQQNALKARIAKYGTVLESWYPLGHADAGLLNEPVFTKLSNKYGKTNAQIILRWNIQAGNVVFPKTTNPEHMRDNIDIFNFELTNEEMKEINALDRGVRLFNVSLVKQKAHLGRFKPAD